MRLLITDVTEMHAGNYCVAGWCAGENRMVRPLPSGATWTARRLSAHGIAPGATVNFLPSLKPHTSAYPHRTEDILIDPGSVQPINADPAPWFGPHAPPTAPTLDEAFQGGVAYNSTWNGVCQGAHVPSGAEVRSLWAVEIERKFLTFNVDEFNGKRQLKAVFFDGNHRYKSAVSSKTLRETWRAGGLDAVAEALPESGSLHVRVGLARAWGKQPDKCYIMINGVYW